MPFGEESDRPELSEREPGINAKRARAIGGRQPIRTRSGNRRRESDPYCGSLLLLSNHPALGIDEHAVTHAVLA